MPINFPRSRKEVDNRAKADVKSKLPNSNPWLKNSFLGAMVTGYSGRIYENYLQLKNALLQMFPDTARGAYLERWGSYVSINRNAPTVATGYVVLAGTAGSVIPAGTVLADSNNVLYTTDTEVTIQTTTQSILTLTRSGSLVTAICSSNHRLATGMEVEIDGAVESEYNGTFEITVVSETTFTYDCSGTPSTPATGTITVNHTSGYVKVTSETKGSDTNQSSGVQLSISTPVSGLASTAYVAYDEIGGGADLEDDESYRDRVIFRYQNPLALFNSNSIINEARKVSGVTRVWVFGAGSDNTDALSVSSLTRSSRIATCVTTTDHQLETGQTVYMDGMNEAGYDGRHKVLVLDDTTFAYTVDGSLTTPATGTILCTPGIPNGQVKIYFVRDDDDAILPSQTELENVRTQLSTIRPAHVYDPDMIIKAPVGITVDFTFTALDPDTDEMREAIINNLIDLFRTETNVSETLQSHAYIAAIWQTVDRTGAIVKDFTLSAPSGDVSIAEGQLPVLGDITFNT